MYEVHNYIINRGTTTVIIRSLLCRIPGPTTFTPDTVIKPLKLQYQLAYGPEAETCKCEIPGSAHRHLPHSLFLFPLLTGPINRIDIFIREVNVPDGEVSFKPVLAGRCGDDDGTAGRSAQFDRLVQLAHPLARLQASKTCSGSTLSRFPISATGLSTGPPVLDVRGIKDE